MIAVAGVLDLVGVLFLAAGLAGAFAARLATAAGLFAIANGLFAVAEPLVGDHVEAAFNFGTAAWCAHLWWTGGGGDGTRRRLRSLRRRFAPVRRSAPVMSS